MPEIKINSKVTKYFSFFSGVALLIIAILTYIRNKEELDMKKEQHTLDKELAQLQISSLKNKMFYGTNLTA